VHCILFFNYISYLLWFRTLRQDHSGWETWYYKHTCLTLYSKTLYFYCIIDVSLMFWYWLLFLCNWLGSKLWIGQIFWRLKIIFGLVFVFGNYQYGIFFERRRAFNSYSWVHYYPDRSSSKKLQHSNNMNYTIRKSIRFNPKMLC